MAKIPTDDTASVPEARAKRKRNYDVVDAQALYAVYPQFFKLVPDYSKINQAIKLGLELPGISWHDVGHPSTEQDDGQ